MLARILHQHPWILASVRRIRTLGWIEDRSRSDGPRAAHVQAWPGRPGAG